jgi:homoserine dehydrogenase
MEDSVRKAVDAIKAESYLAGEPQVIRIERPQTF